ncbi:MAG: hypothetical protein MI739_11555 [Bacteroidales bacterium]|nr:hypothetical protein [Bacteroidales bacterium]
MEKLIITGTVYDLAISGVGQDLKITLTKVWQDHKVKILFSVNVNNDDGTYYMLIKDKDYEVYKEYYEHPLRLQIYQVDRVIHSIIISPGELSSGECVRDFKLITFPSVKGILTRSNGMPAVFCKVELFSTNSNEILGDCFTDEEGKYEILYKKEQIKHNSKLYLKFYNDEDVEKCEQQIDMVRKLKLINDKADNESKKYTNSYSYWYFYWCRYDLLSRNTSAYNEEALEKTEELINHEKDLIIKNKLIKDLENIGAGLELRKKVKESDYKEFFKNLGGIRKCLDDVEGVSFDLSKYNENDLVFKNDQLGNLHVYKVSINKENNKVTKLIYLKEYIKNGDKLEQIKHWKINGKEENLILIKKVSFCSLDSDQYGTKRIVWEFDNFKHLKDFKEKGHYNFDTLDYIDNINCSLFSEESLFFQYDVENRSITLEPINIRNKDKTYDKIVILNQNPEYYMIYYKLTEENFKVSTSPLLVVTQHTENLNFKFSTPTNDLYTCIKLRDEEFIHSKKIKGIDVNTLIN